MLRVAIRVRPGASKAGVGGAVAGRLQVRVHAPAVDGRATDAALRAVAEAFDVRPASVTLVSGATTRDKLLEIEGDEAALKERLTALLAE